MNQAPTSPIRAADNNPAVVAVPEIKLPDATPGSKLAENEAKIEADKKNPTPTHND